MTDRDLLHALEAVLPGLDPWSRDLYALARLRVARGEGLKPTQRSQLARVIHLARHVQSAMAKGERMTHG